MLKELEERRQYVHLKVNIKINKFENYGKKFPMYIHSSSEIAKFCMELAFEGKSMNIDHIQFFKGCGNAHWKKACEEYCSEIENCKIDSK